MMGIKRSNRSRHMFLFLFALLGTSAAARFRHTRRFRSGIRAEDRESVARASGEHPAKFGMFHRCKRTKSRGSVKCLLGGSGIGVTVRLGLAMRRLATLWSHFRENARAYVWTADIRQGDTSDVVLVEVGRSRENSAASNAGKVILHSREILGRAVPQSRTRRCYHPSAVIRGLPCFQPTPSRFRTFGAARPTQWRIPRSAQSFKTRALGHSGTRSETPSGSCCHPAYVKVNFDPRPPDRM